VREGFRKGQMRAFYSTRMILIVSAVALSSSVLAQAATCAKTPAGTFDGKAVWKADKGVGFRSAGLAVDADGAPTRIKWTETGFRSPVMR
jgi:hypothetical protein